jgi:hypothetical protein
MAWIWAALRILPLLALAGCQSYWTRPNATLEGFNSDHKACVLEIGVPIAREGDHETLLVYEDLYRNCLEARGWQRAQGGAEAGRFRGIEQNELVREGSVPKQIP